MGLGLVTRRVGLRLAALACASALAGCAMFEQQGRIPAPTAPAAPPSAPRTVGVDALTTAEHKRLVAQFGGEYRWPAAEHYLNAILARLAAASETPTTPYRVTILNTPVVNAFALPSGNLYVSRGLLELANDSSEIAAVMAHEIGHVTARHAAARAEREKRAAVIAEAAAVIQSRQKSEEVENTQRLSFASFSRHQEIDADRIGINVIARAGYDPYGAARFLTSLGRSTALRAELLGQKSPATPNILATHPSTPQRVALATKAAREIGAPGVGVSDRAGYLAAINGMEFGEDPADGLVRGRRFLQPRLRFMFTAPEGFLLDNTARALLGKAAGGAEALRLDSVPGSSATSLESYLASGWLDGLLRSSIRAGEVNGMPAAFGVARAGEWNFQVAVIRMNGDIYRLMFAARALNDETTRKFDEAIQSFRSITAEEAARITPQKLVVVRAGPGDTVDSLARRMATERPLETFLLLNGLTPGAAARQDEYFKIVVNQ
ncbi:MAG: M48 family metalloprotease [Methylobacteriaceae bacterium]|nr:M48 family metalloprotease [Methylobacteriaceae bacterium]